MAEITLTLSDDEALVLFELLARRTATGGRVEIRHEAEHRVFDAIESALEAQLAAPFAPDYQSQLAEAQFRLAILEV